MVRPKSTVVVPPWFDLRNYGALRGIDAADWYMNLRLRFVLAHADDKNWRQFVDRAFVRAGDPVLLRSHPLPIALAFMDEELGPDFTAIARGKEPRLGVWPMRADELYFFERRFPAPIRDFGRTFLPGATGSGAAPPGFAGPIDQLFERRMTGVFARVDLSLPDAELVRDFRDFIADKRREFDRIGGQQPYRDALRVLSNRRRAKLTTFENNRLLPYLDLRSYVIESGSKWTNANYAEALDLDADVFRETVKYGKLLLQPFVLDGWLVGAAREAVRHTASHSPEASRKKVP